MPEITFQTGEGVTRIFAAPDETLLAAARKANVAIDAPCSGNGVCGKCRVCILSGDTKAPAPKHLTKEEFEQGWRLACETTALTDCVVDVPDIASAYRSRMKTADLSTGEELELFRSVGRALAEAGLGVDSGVSVVTVEMDEPVAGDGLPDNERLARALQDALGLEDEPEVPFFCVVKLPQLMRENGFRLKCVVAADGGRAEILDVLPPDDDTPPAGLAVDIGTTTVAAVLCDLRTGEILAKASSGNGQIRYGADVINRIVEQGRPGGVARLQDAVVRETLLPVIEALCAGSGVPASRIYRLSLAGNTTMEHLLLGVCAEYLRTEPYVPAFFAAAPLDPAEIGVKLAPSCVMTLAPDIGSYVGGDITAGALASMIWDSDGPDMLIDLGTNGEIVFGGREFLMSCACSAGPAFEGGDISCGMRATDGAIEKAAIDADTMEPTFGVIGDTAPVGVCGSGIIDVIASLFEGGIINGKGRFVRDGRRVVRDEFGAGYVLAFEDESGTGRRLILNETDIDSFIRAKGAVFSAIMTLISSLGFTASDLNRISVAGGIGSGINIANAIKIGMLPDLPLDRYRYIGNSSLTGMWAHLVSRPAAEKLAELSSAMTYIELSTEPGYMDAFVAACFLPHTNGSLFPSVTGGAK